MGRNTDRGGAVRMVSHWWSNEARAEEVERCITETSRIRQTTIGEPGVGVL